MLKYYAKIFISCFVAIVVIGLIYGAMMAHSTALLHKAYEALEKDGRPMRKVEIMPLKAPIGYNGAVLYENAASMLRSKTIESQNLLEHLGSLSLSYVKGTLEEQKHDELKQLIESKVVTNAISTIKKGTEYSTCYFHRDYNSSFSVDMLTFQDLYLLANILGAKAYLEAKASASDRAWNIILIQTKLSDAFRYDPVVSSQLQRMEMIKYLCYLIQKVCEIALPKTEDYRKIENLLFNLIEIEPLIHMMDKKRLLIGERFFSVTGTELYEYYSEIPQKNTNKLLHISKVTNRLRFRLASFKPQRIANHAKYLQLLKESVELLQKPYLPKEIELYQKKECLLIQQRLPNILIPMAGYLKERHSDMVANVQVTRIGLALLQYKQVQSIYPKTLDILNLDGAIDPFSQRQLRYCIKNEEFVVYSVAVDRKKNSRKQDQSVSQSDYDIGWHFIKPKS